MPGASWYLKKRQDRIKTDRKGLNILSIDGGGARGLSSLLILHEIMKRIQKIEGLSEAPDPEEYFDLMGGSGTGGIIVTMVGRLQMSTELAIEKYVRLAEVFSERKVLGGGASVFKASKLETTLKAILEEATGNADERMFAEKSDTEICKTMVFAMSKYNLNAGIPCVFRSYTGVANQMPDCAIWEVLRATTAHPDLFKSIDIGDFHARESFVDGSPSCSNPLAHVLEEARQLFPDREVASIISIGAGQARTIQIPKASRFQRILPINAIIAMKDIATDSERVAHEMAQRFRETSGLYFRFSVDQGMQGVGIGQWERLPEVNAHTRAYMRHVECDKTLDSAANTIREGKGTVSSVNISGQVSTNLDQQPTMFKMYPSPTPVFVGCENVLERIRTCFMDHQEDNPRIFILHGLGGMGKTQIVSRYIEMTRDEWDEVVYVDASSHEAITNSYQDLFRLKGKSTPVSVDSYFYWPVSGRWLLVFDGADDPTLGIDKIFPKDWFARRCYILITSRHRDLSLLARGPQSDFHISGMSENDSHELLMKTARLQADELTDEENEAAVALVQDFGYLPLAIAHAGAYIWKSSRTIAQYRSIYLKQKQTLLEEYGKMPIKIDNYARTVHATWMLSYERLSDNAKHLLWLLSFLHLDGIPGDIFQRAKTYLATSSPQIPPTQHELEIRLLAERHLAVWSDAEGQWSELDFLPIISELLSLSLVRYDRINQTYSLHALVHTWAATVVPNKTETLNCAAFLLAASAGWSSKLEDVVFRRKLVLHVDNVLSQGAVTSANLISEFVQVYLDNLRFAQAAALTAQVIDATSQTLGNKHPTTLAKQALLASVYGHQDRWKDAEMLQIQILDDRRRVLGAECVDTLDSLNDLAQTYSEQGRFKESEKLATESLEIRQRVFGEGDPGCLATMALLSDVLRKQNRVEKFNTTLDSALRALGNIGGGFPAVTSPEDLAFSYAKLGKLRFNQKLMVHHLMKRGKTFGRNHPETLRAKCWLATVRYYNHESGLEATESWENIVKRLKDRLGEEHPSTLSSMGWLAESYHSQVELEKAETLQQRVVELRNQVLGADHSDTLTSANSLVSVYQSQGRLEEAELLQERVANGREQVLGKKHSCTLASRNNLAKIYRTQGRLKEAEALGQQVVDTCKQVLGEEQVGTLTSMSNLAIIYRDQGRLDEAEELQVRVVKVHRRLLGDRAPDTVLSARILASIYEAQGRSAEQEGVVAETHRLKSQSLQSLSEGTFWRYDYYHTLHDS